jgi:hypothetical protein
MSRPGLPGPGPSPPGELTGSRRLGESGARPNEVPLEMIPGAVAPTSALADREAEQHRLAVLRQRPAAGCRIAGTHRRPPAARQLGHRDVAMVAKVYGRFKPDTEERDRWERIAAARDAEKWRGSVAKGVAATGEGVEKVDEESPATHYEREASEDSRGGTRTRDPGIMSAVL